MNVLMVEPGKAPYETQIGDDLQSMQAVVGGYIQAVYARRVCRAHWSAAFQTGGRAERQQSHSRFGHGY